MAILGSFLTSRLGIAAIAAIITALVVGYYKVQVGYLKHKATELSTQVALLEGSARLCSENTLRLKEEAEKQQERFSRLQKEIKQKHKITKEREDKILLKQPSADLCSESEKLIDEEISQ